MTSDLFTRKALSGQPLDGCRIIDAHGHLGELYNFPIPGNSADGIVGMMDRIGIDMICVSSLPALSGSYAATGNQEVETAMRHHPGRFFGYMTADIGYSERIRPELERCLAAGFRGIKIHNSVGINGMQLPYNLPNYRTVYEFADTHALPILAHTWGAELDILEPIIRRYPNVNWLLAHAGSTDVDKYIRLGKEYANAYLELAFSACPRGLVERFVAEGLADKVVWGSDAVFFDAGKQIGRVVFAQISPEDKKKILGVNAIRALRLKKRGGACPLPAQTARQRASPVR